MNKNDIDKKKKSPQNASTLPMELEYLFPGFGLTVQPLNQKITCADQTHARVYTHTHTHECLTPIKILIFQKSKEH